MIRILIVDDQKSIRESLKLILQTEKDLTVVGVAADGYEAIEQVRKLQPDVMLVDLEMPSLDGVTLTGMIHRDFTGVKVIVLSMHDEEEYVNRSLQAGAMGYLLKNTPANELKQAIRFVERGYNHFSPGLISKVVPYIPATKVAATAANNHQPIDKFEPLTLSGLKSLVTGKSPSYTRRSWKTYLPYWLGGNLLLWTLAILYLVFKDPVYVSDWAISLPAIKNSTNFSIPNVGSVSSDRDSPYGNSLFDPREDYIFLLRSQETIEAAAARLNMTKSEFGKPETEIIDNTTMIRLSMEGETPELARQKAVVLQKTLEQKLQELRQNQISQTDDSLADSMVRSEENLRTAREKLSQYKANSDIVSQNKLENLSANLENLRRQKAEASAQLKQTTAKVQQLSESLGISTQLAKDAFALHSDSLFQTYLGQYARFSGELIGIESKFQPNTPVVVDKQEETLAARSALISRGETVLGRDLPPQLLQQLSLSTDNDSDSYRGGLLQQVVALQSDAQGLEAQVQELEQQVAQLDAQQKRLAQQESILEQLQQELKFAETVYSSNLANSKLSQTNIYDAYPQIQVAIPPSIPEDPSEPNPKLVLLGTAVSSIFLSSAIASLWMTSRKPLPVVDYSDLNGRAIGASEEDLNKITLFNND